MGSIDALQTLIGIDRTRTTVRGRSVLALMREFLRREALWVTWLNADKMELPFTDLAACVDPSVRCDPAILATAKPISHSLAESRCCANYLHWSALRDAKPTLVQSFGLPEPYEPLLWLWRRGGSFSREHKVFIDVFLVGAVHAGFVEHVDLYEEIVALDEHALGELDRTAM